MTKTFKTLRAIALFEGAKGAIVMLAGLGLLSLVHRDLQTLAGHFIAHLHLNPASRYPRIFLDAAARTNDTRIFLLAVGAATYSAVRFVEAYGLWSSRPWAELLAAASGAIYMPFEVYGWLRHHNWHAAVAFAVNALVVGFMVYALTRRGSASRPPSAGP